MERAGATFPCLLDAENSLSRTFRFKAIPNGILVDENGTIVHQKFGGFDVRNVETRRFVESWLATGSLTGAEPSGRADLDDRVLALFEEGLAAFRDGGLDGARGKWREAAEIDPEHFVVHKQLWAIENPERFYEGRVDMAWQKEQLAQGL
jgi:hypothetical protein